MNKEEDCKFSVNLVKPNNQVYFLIHFSLPLFLLELAVTQTVILRRLLMSIPCPACVYVYGYRLWLHAVKD